MVERSTMAFSHSFCLASGQTPGCHSCRSRTSHAGNSQSAADSRPYHGSSQRRRRQSGRCPDANEDGPDALLDAPSSSPHLCVVHSLPCTSGMDSTVGLDSASALRPLTPSWSHVEFRRLHDPDHRREYSPVNSVVDPRTATRSVC